MSATRSQMIGIVISKVIQKVILTRGGIMRPAFEKGCYKNIYIWLVSLGVAKKEFRGS